MNDTTLSRHRGAEGADFPILTTAELTANPHEAFRRWRKTHRVVAFEAGGYFVLRHADVSGLCNDPRLCATETFVPQGRGLTSGPLFDIFQHGMLTANGEPHARRRAPISRALANQLLDAAKYHARNAAETLIAAFSNDGHLEFVSQFAAHFPIHTLASLLGVRREDTPAFIYQVSQLSRFFAPDFDERETTKCAEAADFLHSYLERMILISRERPKEDFISAFAAEAGRDGLSVAETVAQVVQLILGGTLSVRASVVAQTAALLLRRSQWEAVCKNPDLINAAVNEALRFEPGIAGLVRLTTEDIHLADCTIPAGQLVILSTMSALRDDAIYEHPDLFDINRKPTGHPHLAFGGGAHRCAADALARIELEECLAVLTRRLPGLKLEDIPVLKGFMFTREATPMCVSWPLAETP